MHRRLASQVYPVPGYARELAATRSEALLDVLETAVHDAQWAMTDIIYWASTLVVLWDTFKPSVVRMHAPPRKECTAKFSMRIGNDFSGLTNPSVAKTPIWTRRSRSQCCSTLTSAPASSSMNSRSEKRTQRPGETSYYKINMSSGAARSPRSIFWRISSNFVANWVDASRAWTRQPQQMADIMADTWKMPMNTLVDLEADFEGLTRYV